MCMCGKLLYTPQMCTTKANLRSVHKYACIYQCVCVENTVHVNMHVYMHVCMCGKFMLLCYAYQKFARQKYIHTCANACMHTHSGSKWHNCYLLSSCIYTYIHTYIHTVVANDAILSLRAYTHTYIHAYIQW